MENLYYFRMLMKMLMLMPKCRVIYSGNSSPCTPPFFFLVGWVGAVTHPLPGVPLTFLFASLTEIHGKSLSLSNANANENANANANAKVSRHLFRQQ